jgi:hypothetical protein
MKKAKNDMATVAAEAGRRPFNLVSDDGQYHSATAVGSGMRNVHSRSLQL